MLEMAVHVRGADGRVFAYASASDPREFAEYIATTGCSVSSRKSEPDSPPAGTVWRVGGRVLGRNGDEFTVQMDWSRVVDQGQRVATGAHGSTQAVMRMGDRVTFDAIKLPPGVACGATEVRLEGAMISRPDRAANATVRLAESDDRGNVSGAGAGARATFGSARTSTVALGDPTASPTPVVDVELWLVHRLPDGQEMAERRTFAASLRGDDYRFTPVTIPAPGGNVEVEISGRLAPSLLNGVLAQVDVTIDRHLVGTGSARVDTHGKSRATLAMPSSTDVIQFELQPGDFAALLGEHRFWVRLRVAARR
jgi:hypothetical protein